MQVRAKAIHHKSTSHHFNIYPITNMKASHKETYYRADAQKLHLSPLQTKKNGPFSLRKYDVLQHKCRSIQVKRAPLKTKKQLKFHSRVKCVRRTITKKDSKRLWLQEEDYRSIQQGIRSTIRAVNYARGDLALLDSKEHCILGLEQHLTRRQIVRRRMHTMQRTQAILHQQNYQRYYGICDPHALRNVSKLFSQQESKRAYMRAVIAHSFAEELASPRAGTAAEDWSEGRDEEDLTRHCPVA